MPGKNNLPLAFFLAARELFHDRKLFTMLTAAIVFAVGIQVPNTANLDGAIHAIMDRTVNVMSGHLAIMQENGSEVENLSRIEAELERIDWVEGYLPRTYMAAIVSVGNVSNGVDIIGIVPGKERQISNLDGFVVEGEFLAGSDDLSGASPGGGRGEDGTSRSGSDDNRGNESASPAPAPPTVLGDEFASRLNVGVGDMVTAGFPGGLKMNLTVIGITNIGLGGVDERTIFVRKSLLDSVFGHADSATEILIKTDDAFNARGYRTELQEKLAGISDARVYDWKERMAYVDDILDGNTKTKHTSQVMTIIGVVVPVSALMYVNVKNRRREIGIMMATGMSERMIFRIYLIQALMIASLGVTGGILLGGAICLYYSYYPVVDRANFVVSPYLTPWTFIIPAAILFISTVVSCIYPASKAARINPIDAIWGQ